MLEEFQHFEWVETLHAPKPGHNPLRVSSRRYSGSAANSRFTVISEFFFVVLTACLHYH